MKKPTEQAYAELQRAFDHFNMYLFDSRLPDCLITFQRSNNTMAYFSPKRFVSSKTGEHVDEIAMNPEYFPAFPLIEVLQSLVHEMVHQWQHHYGTPSVRSYHNKEWAQKMIDIGLMPTSTGTEGGAIVGQKIMDYPIPSGLFQRCSLELFKSGFAISWFDRYPAKVASVHDLSLVIDKWRETLSQAAIASDICPADEQLIAMALIAPIQSVDAQDSFSAPAKIKTRHKWECPQCKVSLQGKPSLNVICGVCNQKFVDLDIN
jgi:predicted SprT family Zn-dependent metalloprotease